MQSPLREPLTAEWPLPGGTPWRDALLQGQDQHPGQHGSTERRDPVHDSSVQKNPLRTESTSSSTSTWSTNLKAKGIDALVKIDTSSQATIENSLDGAASQLRQLGLHHVVQHGVQPDDENLPHKWQQRRGARCRPRRFAGGKRRRSRGDARAFKSI